MVRSQHNCLPTISNSNKVLSYLILSYLNTRFTKFTIFPVYMYYHLKSLIIHRYICVTVQYTCRSNVP